MKTERIVRLFTPLGLLLLLTAAMLPLPVLAASPRQEAEPDSASQCEALADLPGLTIVRARLVASGEESVCQVRGVSGQIEYVVNLPVAEAWNGRLVVNGDGGHDGDIDLTGGADTSYAGYAVANSNMGHSAIMEPGSTFAFNNRQAEIDYGYRAVELTTRAAKYLVQQFYGQPAAFSYFNGCSTGGRQGTVAAERYPELFDGIVAGSLFSPAIEVAMEQIWSSAVFMRDVDGDGQGYDNLVPPEELDALRDAVLAKCDVLGNDKIQDGVVNNPRACEQIFTEADIDTLAGERGWSEGQTQAIKDVYRGPQNSGGEPWFRGKPLGSEYAWKFHVVPTPDQFPAGNGMAPFQTGFSSTFVNHLWFEHDPGTPTANPLDPSLLPQEGEYRWLDFDFDRNTPTGTTVNPVLGPWTEDDGGAFMRAILNGNETKLTRLVAGDTKLLLYHGWGDALIPGEPTVDYYEGIVADTFGGNAEKAQANVRLFMVPGMGHCADEFGTASASAWDKLAPMVEWVENGVAPEAIVGTHQDADGNVDNERLICPWPLQPTYMGPTGDGAENDPANWVADNFECLPQE